MDHHPDMKDPPSYSFKIIKRHKTCLERQLHEALAIENMKPDYIMNAKSEWGRNRIPRLQNIPPEEFITPSCTNPTESTNKRNSEGFKIRQSDSPSEELGTPSNANQTTNPESFLGQFKQRKRARIQKEQDKREQAMINDETQAMNVRSPRKKTSEPQKQSY